MIRHICLLILISLFSSLALAAGEVYVLRLDDEIGSRTWRYTREALNEAETRGADMPKNTWGWH